MILDKDKIVLVDIIQFSLGNLIKNSNFKKAYWRHQFSILLVSFEHLGEI